MSRPTDPVLDRVLFATFDPAQHPHGADGRFAPVGGGSSVPPAAIPHGEPPVVEGLPEGADGPAPVEAASRAWAAALTPGERRAVGAYTDESYRTLNAALRADPGGAGLSSKQKKLAEKLGAAVRKFPPFPEPLTSYRGLDVTSREKTARLDAAFSAALLTGEPVTLNGFSSADLDPARAASRAGDGRLVLEIRSRRGAYVRAATSCPGEHEVLHAHGERFRVVAVKDAKYRMKWGGALPRKTYVLEAVETAPPAAFDFNPDQPRAADGKFGSGGASAAPPPLKEVTAAPRELDAAASAWASGLSPFQRQAIAAYTGDDYYSQNKKLRECPESFDCLGGKRADAVALDRAIRSFPAPAEPLTSYRGLTSGKSPAEARKKIGEIEAGLQAALASGQPVRMDGFQSATLDPMFAVRWAKPIDDVGVVLEIKSPRGAYIAPDSDKPEELEVLHNHGEQYRVTGVREEAIQRGGGTLKRRLYTLEAVADAPPLPPSPPPGTFAGPEGTQGDLDPDGHWVTVSGNKIHITADGEIDAGGHPALRKILEEKAGIPSKLTGDARHDYGDGYARPTAERQFKDMPPALKARTAKWAAGLTEGEVQSIHNYMHAGFRPFNRVLRAAGGDVEALPADVPVRADGPDSDDPPAGMSWRDVGRHLMAAVRAHGPLAEPLTCWRTLNMAPDRMTAFLAAADAAEAAQAPLKFPVFGSATLNPNWAPEGTALSDRDAHEVRPGVVAVTEFPSGARRHRVLLEIRSRSGVYIGGLPDTTVYSRHENELLQPPQAQYRIAGWKGVGFGGEYRRVLRLEELPPDPALYAPRPGAAFAFDPAKHPKDEHGKWAAVQAAEAAGTAPAGAPSAGAAGAAGAAPAPYVIATCADRPYSLGMAPAGLPEAAERWAGGLDAETRRALNGYTQADFRLINPALRQSPGSLAGLDPDTARSAGLIDAAIRAFPKPAAPLTTYRGVHCTRPAKLAGIEAGLRAAHATGGLVTLAGFNSASLSPTVAANDDFNGGVVLEIRSPRGAFLRPVTGLVTEYEVLHPHNDCYRVTGVHPDGAVATPSGPEPVRVYVLEAVPDEPPPFPPFPTADEVYGPDPEPKPPVGPAGSAATQAAYPDPGAVPFSAGSAWDPERHPRGDKGWFTSGSHDPHRGYDDAAERPAEVKAADLPVALKNRAADWRERLTADESRALTAYVGSAFRDVNRALRDAKGVVSKIRKVKVRAMAERLVSALARFGPTDPPVTVWRGAALPVETAQALLASPPGAEVSFPCFQSCSIGPSMALMNQVGEAGPYQKDDSDAPSGYVMRQDVLFEIRARTGAWLAGGGFQGMLSNENEWLAAPGVKYRVVGVKDVPFADRHGDPTTNRRVVQLEEVPREVSAFADFDPDQHPRDAAGRFGPAGSAPPAPTAAPSAPLGRLTPEDVPARLRDASVAWAESLPYFESQAVGQYTHTEYTDINDRLRAVADGRGDVGADRTGDLARRLDAAVRRFPPHDPPLTSYRGVASSDPERAAQIRAGLDAALAAGGTVTLNGFSSATLSPFFASSWACDSHDHKGLVLEITSPRGAYIANGSVSVRELEVLHAHGERFRVTGVRDQEYLNAYTGEKRRTRTYALEAIPEPPPPLPPAPPRTAPSPVAPAALTADFAAPNGAQGDLDPEGRWVTVSGNKIHITKAGEIDAGGPPAVRELLNKTGDAVARGAAGGPADRPTDRETYREHLRDANLFANPATKAFEARRGQPLSDAEKADWKARVAAIEATEGRKLGRYETAAELFFPGEHLRGQRLENFLYRGDPDRGPPVHAAGAHPVEAAARAAGAWTPGAMTDERFAAHYPDVHAALARVAAHSRAALDAVLPGVTPQDLAALAGWQPGDDPPRVVADPANQKITLDLVTRKAGTYAKLARVHVTRTDRGAVLDLEEFNVGAPFQGKGAGTRAVAAMLGTAARLGVPRAHTGGVGCGPKSHENEGRGLKYRNGYYTWPILGFDRAFDAEEREHLTALPAPFHSAQRLSDLLTTTGGPKAWKDYGWGVSCDLDLARPETPGMTVLAAYLAAKAGAPAKETT